jgi:hypothetical protein
VIPASRPGRKSNRLILDKMDEVRYISDVVPMCYEIAQRVWSGQFPVSGEHELSLNGR